MRVIHILGRKKNGKTTLITDLASELTSRGHKIGTIKHCGHDHELDTPGTDSYKHRMAGALTVAILTPSLDATFTTTKPNSEGYDHLKQSFQHCDLVLVEGHSQGPGPKIEVWRQQAGTEPKAFQRNDVLAIVTDDTIETSLPVWPRSDIGAIADRVLELAREV